MRIESENRILKPRNKRNFTKGMRFHVTLVLAFWKSHKLPQGLLISCCFVTFVVPSSESGLSGGLSAGRELFKRIADLQIC